VNSYLTEDFIAHFARLPEDVKAKARKNYRLWKKNPNHPGLHFKRVHAKEPVFAIRIGRGWRALGLMENDTIAWFWIGSHSDYDKIVAEL
jgi:hypothetical protein